MELLIESAWFVLELLVSSFFFNFRITVYKFLHFKNLKLTFLIELLCFFVELIFVIFVKFDYLKRNQRLPPPKGQVFR